mgnify:CR=1 FL=1
MTDYDDRDDRPSWSEIDRRRDRSSHVRQDSPESRKKPSAHDEWIKKQYRKEIEKLFKGTKEETEEQKKARMEIGRAYGTGKFNTVVRQYVKQHGLPSDWSTLILMLDHKDSPLVRQVLEDLSGAGTVTVEGVQEVGPAVGKKLQSQASWAVFWAIILIMVYIWARFEYRFGIAAAIATIHDVVAVVGVMWLLQKDFTMMTVSALLTLAGYSLSDTVVVYDRIRENMRKSPQRALGDTINLSINETLGRTLLTSLTVFLVVLALLLTAATIGVVSPNGKEVGPFLPIEQAALTILVLSMLIAPFIIHYSESIIMRFVASEWMMRSMQLTTIAARSMGTEKHAILCGFGRSGQYLARFLAQEAINYIALDLDPDRVREAAAGGETVVFGDAGRKDALIAAGLMRASVVIITVSDTPLAEKILYHVLAARPDIPVIVRTADERNIDRLSRAGAAEVVPEALEASLMLASHALVLLGVPPNRVLKRIRQTRSQRYSLLRGFYRGISDHDRDDIDEQQQPRLHSVLLEPGAGAIGRTLDELDLEELGCDVSAIRRRGIRAVEPAPETRLEEGDVVVLLGAPEAVTIAEERLLQ